MSAFIGFLLSCVVLFCVVLFALIAFCFYGAKKGSRW